MAANPGLLVSIAVMPEGSHPPAVLELPWLLLVLLLALAAAPAAADANHLLL